MYGVCMIIKLWSWMWQFKNYKYYNSQSNVYRHMPLPRTFLTAPSGSKFVTSVPIKRPKANPILAPNALNATTGRITTYATVILTQFSNSVSFPPIDIFK